MHQICLEHGEVTTWGCRQCVRERVEDALREASARFERELKRIFKTKRNQRS